VMRVLSCLRPRSARRSSVRRSPARRDVRNRSGRRVGCGAVRCPPGRRNVGVGGRRRPGDTGPCGDDSHPGAVRDGVRQREARRVGSRLRNRGRERLSVGAEGGAISKVRGFVCRIEGRTDRREGGGRPRRSCYDDYRRLLFAWYIAVSAAWTRASGVVPGRPSTTPILA
jgi:hypothetical protein